MTPDCFKDWIGVKCLTPSKSGYWINDLEGLSLTYAADIADSNYVSGLQLLQSKIDFATALVLQELKRYAIPYYRIHSVVDEMRLGQFRTTWTAPAPVDRGVKFTVKNSRLLRIRINEVKIRLQAPATHSFTIIDGPDQTVFNFTTDSNGEASVVTDYLSNTREVFVLMDNTAVTVNNTEIKTGCGCNSMTRSYLTGYGWNGNVSNTTYGLQVFANAECSLDDIGCVLMHHLTFPILYKAGFEVAKEAATTERLNSVTLLGLEKANFLMENFSNEFDKHMKILIDSIPSLMNRLDDCCITCNQSRYVYGTP